MKKTLIMAMAVLLAIAALSGCTLGASGRPMLKEPEYAGLEVNGKPKFELSWTRVPAARSYEVAIFTELEGFSDRYTTTRDGTRCTLVFLQGINTDTVSYRIKVRAKTNGGDSEWSNIWLLDYVNGEYTLSDNAPEFDTGDTAQPKAAATPQTARDDAASEHSFPETLAEFREAEGGGKPELSDPAKLIVYVDHCEYAEPEQIITDEKTIDAVTEALSGITVTELADKISSTGTSYGYSLYDANGDHLASFTFQDGLLLGKDGRYSADGTEALFSVDGIMLGDDFSDYWEERDITASDKEYEFESSHPIAFPMTLFDAEGYAANELADAFEKGSVDGVSIYVDWNDEAGRLETADDDTIAAILGALSDMTVTGKTDDTTGQRWFVIFDYTVPDDVFPQRVIFEFEGSALVSDRGVFEIDGLEKLFPAYSCDVLDHLAENRESKQPDPVF